ncbi:Eisosome component PIL1-domain-containing protein [Crassisporium funariophilum]|nr:Eisosome component PIL1-domain-containing protein [Crassisporium funariophilum]
MPVPGFLASFADKAQNAIHASPLAAHLPAAYQRPGSPDASTQPTANEAAGQGASKSHTLEALQYQFRSLQQQYSTTTPVQKIITAEKGVAIDFDSASRNSKAQSKELYTWGQTEADDLKDVTDRLAYLNFVQGSLAGTLATKLDAARAPIKALRDAEAAITPRRNIRAGLQTQIARVEHETQKGNDRRLVDLRDQLKKAELEDQQQEREIDLLKRKALRESEQLKWDAVREYGEKLVLLSQAASPILTVLPAIPPNATTPYLGAQTTAAARASLQRALDNYKTGHINLPPHVAGADLSRSDTRSFGESHASELSSIHSTISSSSIVNMTPPSTSKPLPVSPGFHAQPQSPPINPQALNQMPAPIPAHTPISGAVPDPVNPTNNLPPIMPTVAETGVPVSAGPEGPGPASGSLHDIKGASALAGPRSGGLPGNEQQSPGYGQAPAAFGAAENTTFVGGLRHESAEDEKKRLAAVYSQQAATTSSAPPPQAAPSTAPVSQPPHHETAEEEKKRLEREERERILHAGAKPGGAPPKDGNNEDLPPYQEPGFQ